MRDEMDARMWEAGHRPFPREVDRLVELARQRAGRVERMPTQIIAAALAISFASMTLSAAAF